MNKIHTLLSIPRLIVYAVTQYAYASHEDVARGNKLPQDGFVKYVFPQSERTKALDKLALMNITAFSLFGSEESLMETMGYAEIEKRIMCIAPDEAEK